MDYDLVTGTCKKELYLYLQCPYGRKWHLNQRGASGGGDVQKAPNRGPYSSDALSWTYCEHNSHSVAHSSGQCGTSLPRHVAVALGTVDSSNVGHHPCGNVEQHVIGFATRNAVGVIYATTVATNCYALGTHYYALGVADANAATPFGVIPSISIAIQFACVHLHTDCFLVY